MATSDDLEAKQPGVQLIQGVLNSVSPLEVGPDELPLLAYLHAVNQTQPYPVNEHPLDGLPLEKFPSELFARMQVGYWVLQQQQATSIQLEGFVNDEEPRNVVKDELIKPGKVFSGIFRIIATFQGPDNKIWKMKGTAFAVSEDLALTSAHVMWHEKLGPAKMAALCVDERLEFDDAQSHITCNAVAMHARWMKFHQREHDFCMVSMAQPFNSGVLPLRLELASKTLPCKGKVVGFPLDFPVTSSKGSQLIECQGSAKLCRTKAGNNILIKHKVNTAGGNSGSPLYDTRGNVVGVHCSFVGAEGANYAVPINMNGNNVSQFEGILRHMRDPRVKLPDTTSELGETIYKYHKVFAFGQQDAAS
ncbi:trypsin-like cysteine/serine peptidase domain-containing protein [Xylaria cubensis]|nr:trypsin-like cysteine/serine peptidase domain-containing protein [Xylaria cubensis]